MKGEHRKELQTNILANRVGRFVEDFKSSQQARSAAVIVIVAVAVLTYIGWQWSMSLSGKTNEMWLNLDEDALIRNAPEDQPRELARKLDSIAQLAPATLPARTARFQEARLRLSSGMLNLYGPRHIEAADDLDRARGTYKGLIDQTRDDPILMQEALMGVAQIEETLAGVPDLEDAEKPMGNLDQAAQAYRTLASKFPDGYLGKQAAARLQKLEEDRKGVEQFYASLRKQAAAKPLFGMPAGHP